VHARALLEDAASMEAGREVGLADERAHRIEEDDLMTRTSKNGFAIVGLLSAATFLGACVNDVGGNGSGGTGTTGPVTIAITDAASNDIVSLWVEISSIRLVNVAGAEVSLLSAPIEVDLAALTDMSQVIGSANIPAGMYTQANVTIDFFGSSAHLVGHGGAANIVDSTGSPVNVAMQLPLMLDTPLSVSVTTHQLLELDFDLNQSFTVDPVANTVVLEPAYLLRVNPASPKPLSVAATLLGVNTATSTFTGAVHATGGGTVSTITFHTVPSTTFQVDGVVSTGSAGLTALSLLGPGGSMQCFGGVSPTSDKFEVTSCWAGTGTFNGGTDVVEGHVVGRTGGPGSDAVLQLLGQSSDASHSTFAYNVTFAVNTSFASTKVVRAGSSTAFDTDDLNVGQFVRIYGTLTGTTLDATAATSVARIERTRVFGVATTAPVASTLTMMLSVVGRQPQNVFTWTEGGASPPDPNAFTIDIGTLGNGLGIVTGSNATARGFFPPVDDVGPDFKADALNNADTDAVLILVRNDPNTGFTVGVTTSTTQIQLNIAGTATAGEVAVVDNGLVGTSPLATSPAPTLTRPSMTGTYSLRDRGTGAIQVFTHFSDYASALGSLIAQGATLIQIGATGTYNVGTNTMDASVSAAVIE
jgi:uncharacterized protein DUF4382